MRKRVKATGAGVGGLEGSKMKLVYLTDFMEMYKMQKSLSHDFLNRDLPVNKLRKNNLQIAILKSPKRYIHLDSLYGYVSGSHVNRAE